MRLSPLAVLLSLILAGCNGETMLSGGGGNDSSIDGGVEGQDEENFPQFEGATLVVYEPLSASILPVGVDIPFSAEVLGSDGEVLDFDGIEWTSDQVEDTVLVGLEGEAPLPFGIHAITATANLPNGDRLQSTEGGVRVQGEHTGVYAGNLNIQLSGEFQGTAITTACVGGLDFVVDMSGEILGGDGQCSLSLVIMDPIDLAYDLSADIAGDEAEGDVSLDMGFLPIGMDWTGSFEDDELVGDFEGGLLTFDMQGSIEAHRISLYVDP